MTETLGAHPGRRANHYPLQPFVAGAFGFDRRMMLQWVLAFAGLSAAGFLEDDALEHASGQLKVAKIAAPMLDA